MRVFSSSQGLYSRGFSAGLVLFFLLAGAGCDRNAGENARPSFAKESPGDPKSMATPAPSPEEVALREILEQAPPLVEECRRLGPPEGRVTLQGKALIADLETGQRRKAHYPVRTADGQPELHPAFCISLPT